jgi:processing peptidase subunit alpha
MLEVMLSEFLYMTREVSDIEFQRAKNKLKSDMFMDLESRIVQIDDLIRQVLLWNKRVNPDEHARMIDAVSKEDLLRVAKEICLGKMTLVSYGPADSVKVIPPPLRIRELLLENLDKMTQAKS